MANTFVAIATTTVGSGGASSIDFQNIPATYDDLLVKYSGRSTGTDYFGQFYFNNNTTGYTRRGLYGDGSAAGSLSISNQYTLVVNPSGYAADTFGNSEVYIPNYAGSNNKSFSVDATTENYATLSYAFLYAGLWSNTAAINRITLVAEGGNFVQHSTATIYGIKKD